MARNASRLRHPIRDAADFAANSMLMDRAQHFQQLTGNYSRVHFHHPGPAFLYVGAAGQWLFHQVLHVVPADFNGQLIAFFILNAALAGLVVTELHRHVPSAAGLRRRGDRHAAVAGSACRAECPVAALPLRPAVPAPCRDRPLGRDR